MAEKLTIPASAFRKALTRPAALQEMAAGEAERQLRWDQVRVSAAQAIIQQPEILTYFKLLRARKVSRDLSELHGLACRLIEAIYDVRHAPSKEVPTESEDVLRATDVAPEELSPENLRALIPLLAKVTKSVAGSAVSNKTVLTDDAGQRIQRILPEIARRQNDIAKDLAAVTAGSAQMYLTLLPTAASSAVVEARKAVQMPPSATGLTSLISVGGVLRSLSVPSSAEFKVNQGSRFPVGMAVSILGTTVEMTVDPRLLRIQAGDYAKVGSQESVITSVSSTGFQTATALPSGELRVVSALQRHLMLLLPTLRDLRGLSQRKIDAARLDVAQAPLPFVSRILAEVSNLAAAIAPLTLNAVRVLRYFGVVEPSGSSALTDLYAAGIPASKEVSEAARLLETTLRSQGFDRAAESLRSGRYEIFAELSFTSAVSSFSLDSQSAAVLQFSRGAL